MTIQRHCVLDYWEIGVGNSFGLIGNIGQLTARQHTADQSAFQPVYTTWWHDRSSGKAVCCPCCTIFFCFPWF